MKKITIDYYVDNNNSLVINYTPEEDIADGLVIEHGREIKSDHSMAFQPALKTDLKKGISIYEMPPANILDLNTIKEVYVNIPE